LPELADDRLATTSLEAARAALKTDRSTRQ